MGSLRVDTGILRQTGADLRRVAAEFAQAGANSDCVAEAIAHPGLAGAVRAFADTWDRRRQEMLADLAELAAATTATAEGIDHVDAELGRALLGQASPGQSGSAPLSGAGPIEQLRLTTVGQAGYRPADWHPLAAADPVPGSPQIVGQGAAHYSAVAATISSAAAGLRRLAADTAMRSEAVTTIRDHMGSLAQDIAKAEQRYAAAGAALREYAPALDVAQGETMRALLRTRDAEDGLARAAARIQAAQSALVPPAIESPDVRTALALQTESEELLRSAQRAFEKAVRVHVEAGMRAEHQLNDGRSGDGLGDSAWDKFKGAAVDVLQLVSRAADIVAMGAGVLALVTMWCPPLSAFFASIATYATLVSLASKLLLQSLGEDIWTEIAWSVAGLAVLGLARIAAGALRTSVAGAQGAARAAAGSAAATSPAARAAAGLPANRNSAAAVRAMLGSSATPSRQAATDAALRSLDEGFLPSASEALRSLRALPGETFNDLRAIRGLDVHNLLQQLRTSSTLHPFALMGQPGAAAELRALSAVHPGIRADAEVMVHRNFAVVQGASYLTAWGTGVGFFVVEAGHMSTRMAGPAERLNLPGAGQ